MGIINSGRYWAVEDPKSLVPLKYSTSYPKLLNSLYLIPSIILAILNFQRDRPKLSANAAFLKTKVPSVNPNSNVTRSKMDIAFICFLAQI